MCIRNGMMITEMAVKDEISHCYGNRAWHEWEDKETVEGLIAMITTEAAREIVARHKAEWEIIDRDPYMATYSCTEHLSHMVTATTVRILPYEDTEEHCCFACVIPDDAQAAREAKEEIVTKGIVRLVCRTCRCEVDPLNAIVGTCLPCAAEELAHLRKLKETLMYGDKNPRVTAGRFRMMAKQAATNGEIEDDWLNAIAAELEKQL